MAPLRSIRKEGFKFIEAPKPEPTISMPIPANCETITNLGMERFRACGGHRGVKCQITDDWESLPSQPFREHHR